MNHVAGADAARQGPSRTEHQAGMAAYQEAGVKLAHVRPVGGLLTR